MKKQQVQINLFFADAKSIGRSTIFPAKLLIFRGCRLALSVTFLFGFLLFGWGCKKPSTTAVTLEDKDGIEDTSPVSPSVLEDSAEEEKDSKHSRRVVRERLKSLDSAAIEELDLRLADGDDLYLDLSEYDGAEDDLALLKQLESKLIRLRLFRAKIGDRGLKHLSGLKNLRELNLRADFLTETPIIGDAGLKHLSGLKNLRKLDLGETQVGDRGLKHLSGLKNLRKLNLIRTQVGDSGLKHLSGLKNLRKLYLVGTQIGDGGLKHLSGLKNLRELDLEETQVGDGGLKHLFGLKNLRKLNVFRTYVTDHQLKLLAYNMRFGGWRSKKPQTLKRKTRRKQELEKAEADVQKKSRSKFCATIAKEHAENLRNNDHINTFMSQYHILTKSTCLQTQDGGFWGFWMSDSEDDYGHRAQWTLAFQAKSNTPPVKVFQEKFVYDEHAEKVFSLSLFDFDGDGREEAILRIKDWEHHGSMPPRVVIFTSSKKGSGEYPATKDLKIQDITDFDGDGRPDLILLSPYSYDYPFGHGMTYYGPPLFARSMEDGTFSTTHPAAEEAFKEQCILPAIEPAKITNTFEHLFMVMDLFWRRVACFRHQGGSRQEAFHIFLEDLFKVKSRNFQIPDVGSISPHQIDILRLVLNRQNQDPKKESFQDWAPAVLGKPIPVSKITIKNETGKQSSATVKPDNSIEIPYSADAHIRLHFSKPISIFLLVITANPALGDLNIPNSSKIRFSDGSTQLLAPGFSTNPRFSADECSNSPVCMYAFRDISTTYLDIKIKGFKPANKKNNRIRISLYPPLKPPKSSR